MKSCSKHHRNAIGAKVSENDFMALIRKICLLSKKEEDELCLHQSHCFSQSYFSFKNQFSFNYRVMCYKFF